MNRDALPTELQADYLLRLYFFHFTLFPPDMNRDALPTELQAGIDGKTNVFLFLVSLFFDLFE
jgi:hypothetical protein